MPTITELRQERASVIAESRALLDKVDSEKRDMTEDEETRWEALEKREAELKADIEKAESMESRKAALAAKEDELKKPAHSGAEDRAKPLPKVIDEQFRNFGEFVGAVVGASMPGGDFDQRLKQYRVQQMKNATTGGYTIPEQFLAEILQVSPDNAVVRPRARVIPAGDPPDAEIRIPKLAQGAASNRFGGVVIHHQGESDALTESTSAYEQITLKPHKLTGYMTASTEFINNSIASSAFLQGLMRDAVIAAEDTDFLTGNGVNRALGLLNCPGRVNVARAGAGAIAYADIVGMYARLLMQGGSAVWIASQTTIPSLATIGDGTNNIFVTNAAAGMPMTLLGIPVVFSERVPALGTAGDLILAKLNPYYIIKDGSAMSLAVSEHARFQNDEVAFRITHRVDGQLWLDEPIGLEGSTANTVSPVVVLN